MPHGKAISEADIRFEKREAARLKEAKRERARAKERALASRGITPGAEFSSSLFMRPAPASKKVKVKRPQFGFRFDF